MQMSPELLKKRNFEIEMEFSSSRSSGPGGQNVNKVNTRIELRFDVQNSQALSEFEKYRLLHTPSRHLLASGILQFSSQEYRTQLQNKQDAIEKFYQYLALNLSTRKKRTPTRPTRTAVEKRLTAKKIMSDRKAHRQKPDL